MNKPKIMLVNSYHTLECPCFRVRQCGIQTNLADEDQFNTQETFHLICFGRAVRQ